MSCITFLKSMLYNYKNIMLYLTTALVERVEREVFRPSPPEDRGSLYYIRKLLNFKRCFAAIIYDNTRYTTR